MMTSRTTMVYDLIQSKASGNELMQGNMFKFKTPSISIVEKLLDCAENVSVETFDSKMERTLGK